MLVAFVCVGGGGGGSYRDNSHVVFRHKHLRSFEPFKLVNLLRGRNVIIVFLLSQQHGIR